MWAVGEINFGWQEFIVATTTNDQLVCDYAEKGPSQCQLKNLARFMDVDEMPVTAYYAEGNVPQLSATRTDEVVACKIKYLNEGGANFVFSILKAGSELPKPLRGKLLRLRKDLSHVQSTKEQVESFNNNFRPLFPPDCLVQPELVCLNNGLTTALNRTLDALNRPARRSADCLPEDERYGLLVTDMMPAAADNYKISK